MAKNTEKITIKIEGEKWQKALDKSFQKNVKNAKIDGFRKGNVPKNIYLERYGIASLYEEAINKYGQLEYEECFGFVPVLPMGGKKDVDHLEKVNEKVHIALITQVVGRIE